MGVDAHGPPRGEVDPCKKVDAQTAAFTVEIPPDGEKVPRFTTPRETTRCLEKPSFSAPENTEPRLWHGLSDFVRSSDPAEHHNGQS
jgi:hypothetical protein